jgi:hypothetical protein
MFWGKKRRREAENQLKSAFDLVMIQGLSKTVSSVLEEVLDSQSKVDPRTIAVLSIITSDAFCQRINVDCSFEMVAMTAAVGLITRSMQDNHEDPEALGEAAARELDVAGDVFNSIATTPAGLIVMRSLASQMTALCRERIQIDDGEIAAHDSERLERARQSVQVLAALVAKHSK